MYSVALAANETADDAVEAVFAELLRHGAVNRLGKRLGEQGGAGVHDV